MKKIGIMGGTFNPIHNAHLMMAQAAYEQYGLDEVWFMPSKNPPHKEKENIVSDEHRSRMIMAAIDSVPYFSFSDMELKREGITYTSDTVRLLKEAYPKDEFYFILGGDSLEYLHKWHEPTEIMKYCTILAAPRGCMTVEDTARLCQERQEEIGGKILPIKMELVSISSERIRDTLQKGEDIIGICPDKVLRYIRLHGLYGQKVYQKKTTSISQELLNYLAASLRPKRYLHTLGVCHTASALAMRHNVDVRKAELAGVLHDCAKYYTGEEMIALCEEYGIELTDVERKNTALIHGKLGAYLAEKRYGVEDEEILMAIRYHTTGRPGMSKLEKIIYIADYIEPARTMECKPHSLEEIRKVCFKKLNKGLLMILENSVSFLNGANKKIDPMTEETYQYYEMVRKEKEKKK